jgi:hypothetical protein
MCRRTSTATWPSDLAITRLILRDTVCREATFVMLLSFFFFFFFWIYYSVHSLARLLNNARGTLKRHEEFLAEAAVASVALASNLELWLGLV